MVHTFFLTLESRRQAMPSGRSMFPGTPAGSRRDLKSFSSRTSLSQSRVTWRHCSRSGKVWATSESSETNSWSGLTGLSFEESVPSPALGNKEIEVESKKRHKLQHRNKDLLLSSSN